MRGRKIKMVEGYDWELLVEDVIVEKWKSLCGEVWVVCIE